LTEQAIEQAIEQATAGSAIQAFNMMEDSDDSSLENEIKKRINKVSNDVVHYAKS
jgi:hypothetical protein